MRDAIAEMEKAVKLEPLNAGVNSTLAWALYLSGDYENAAKQCLSAKELDPNFALAWFYYGQILLAQGKFAEAAEQFENAILLSRGMIAGTAALVQAHALAGNRAKALEGLKQLERNSHRTYVSPFDLALIYTALGDYDAAFDRLEASHAERGWLNHIHVFPALRPLHSDPRFADLLRRTGIPAVTGRSGKRTG
jgi:tetratricopeptide (TPR) repeat protein